MSSSSPIYVLAVAWLVACANPRPAPTSETTAIHLTVVGTNDLHGWVMPHETRLKDGKVAQIGGLSIFSSYLKILREENPLGLLLVDSGDIFQGTLVTNFTEGEVVIAAYNALQYDGLAIGNHELDYGPLGPRSVAIEPGDDPFGALKARAKQAQFPLLARNVYLAATGERPDFLQKNGTMIIERQGLRIGLVGLVTPLTPQVTNPVNVRSLRFAPLASEALAAAKDLREQGAEILVALVHTGGRCINLDNPLSLDKDKCDRQGEIFKMLNKLPTGLFDAVVAGHTHARIGHFINGMPVIESNAYGSHFGTIDLFIDPTTKRPIPGTTQIHAAIPLCGYFFQGTQNCELSSTEINSLPLVQASFHQKPIMPDQSIDTLLSPFLNSVDSEQHRSLQVQVTKPLTRTYYSESLLGNALADIIRTMEKTDVVLLNPGGFRADLPAGELTYGSLFEVFPFDNSISTLTITGNEIINMLEALVKSGHGAPQISGVRVVMAHCGAKSRVTSISFADGRDFDRNQTYHLTTSDFLALGGDGESSVVSTISPQRLDLGYGRPLNMREALANWLNLQKGKLESKLDGRMVLKLEPATGCALKQ